MGIVASDNGRVSEFSPSCDGEVRGQVMASDEDL